MEDRCDTVSMAQRRAGCLLGLAWGDALGCPVEFWEPTDVTRVFGHYTGLPAAYPFARLPAEESLWAHLRPLGLHSDDTQQALALIRICLAPAGWNIGAWADILVRGQQQKAWRGTGRFFRAAVGALAQGASPLVSGGKSAGVGASMRIAPLGALFADEPEMLARVVLESSRVTHVDARAIAGAFAIACACAGLVRGEPADRVRAGLVTQVRAFEEKIRIIGIGQDESSSFAFSEALEVALDSAHTDLAASRSALCAHARARMEDGGHMPLTPNHPFAPVGCAHALSAALWPDTQPQQLLAEVIRQGGDTDTIGAMAGGLLGARYGCDWIAVQSLRDGHMLSVYAQALSSRILPEDEDAFLRREAAYSAEERRFSRECVERFHALLDRQG